MSLWDRITGWWQSEATRYLYAPIPPDRVEGVPYDPEPHKAGRDYFRLWLAEMFLRRDREWFATRYPAVHSSIRFQFGGDQTDIPHVAGPLRLKDVDAAHLDRAVLLNYPMTTLMPFNGGVVDLTAAMLAMKGEDSLRRFLGVMGEFSGLLAVPQLSAALKVARPIADGIEQLLGASDGALHLALHQAFAAGGGGGGNELRPGYLAVVLAPERELPADRLRVRGDRLCTGTSAAEAVPLQGYDYLLFRVEKRAERDDWESLTTIRDPFDKALEALGVQEAERAESLLRTAVVMALQSPDLTQADRRRVAQALKARYDEAKDLGLGAVPGQEPTFAEVIARAGSPDGALARGRLSLETLFGADRAGSAW